MVPGRCLPRLRQQCPRFSHRHRPAYPPSTWKNGSEEIVMSEFNHLNPDTRDLLHLSTAERAGRMLIERFIAHERLVPILNHVEFLIRMPPQTRANGLVVS